MSTKPFETFLAENFISWGEKNLQPGYRYHYQSPDSYNSTRLFRAVIAQRNGVIEFNDVELSYLTLNNVNIIPMLHVDNGSDEECFSDNYIAMLRDEIKNFNGFSILLIHNSLLDTLITSFLDLAKPKMVWNPEEIKKSLHSLLDPFDKNFEVSVCLLENRFEEIREDGVSMFGFRELHKAVCDGDLRFDELFLFEDPLILDMKGQSKQIKKRLEENRQLYKKIQHDIEHFPGQLEDRLKDFGSRFIKNNFTQPDDGSWKNITFETYLKEKIRNKEQHIELEEEVCDNGEVIFQNKSETKAGKRDRHLIIQVDPGLTEFPLKITFLGQDIVKDQLSILHNDEIKNEIKIDVTKSSKRSFLNFDIPFSNHPQYFTIKLNREKSSERYHFRCLAIPKGAFHIDAFSSCYLVEPNKKRITLRLDENYLQIKENDLTEYELVDTGEDVDSDVYSKVMFENLAEEADIIQFGVKKGDYKLYFNIEGAVAPEALSLPILLDNERYNKLFDDSYSAEYNSSKRLVLIDNKERKPVGVRDQLLALEWDFIKNKDIYIDRINKKAISLKNIEHIAPDLHFSYLSLFSYLEERKSTISLVSWGPKIQGIISDIAKSYKAILESIPKGSPLNNDQKLLLQIGLVKMDDRELMSSYHPLTLSYYLYLAERVSSDDNGSFKDLPKITLSRLNHKGLIPYLYNEEHGFSYTQLLEENPFWVEFVPQKQNSYEFVRKLVNEKIAEFLKTFSVLFPNDSESSLIINSVNNYDNETIFLGILDYFKGNLDNCCYVHVNLYDNTFKQSEFDIFSEETSLTSIKQRYGLDKGKNTSISDLLIETLRKKLTYSKFEHDAISEQLYSHITFFRNTDEVESIEINVDDHVSGVSCNGLICGEASESKEGSYYTAFGLRNVDSEAIHLQIAKLFGSLFGPSRKVNAQFHGANATAIAVNEDFKKLLDRSYDSSVWTTIIDPKVTLDFFRNQVLIHYSDQYTDSASYDAITVTSEKELYSNVLAQKSQNLIGEFNAFNGDWLLKMMTSDENIRKERKGIIGAYKFIFSILSNSSITWIPLSLGELIRVAGNIGLKASESDFSRSVQGYKSGAISDDVLFAGFKDGYLFLLPVEVKTGARPDYQKAVTQTKELKRFLGDELLAPRTLAGELYRGLFVRHVLIQVAKYELYDVFSEGYFDEFLNEREEWLKGSYAIGDLKEYPGGFVVAHVDSDTCYEPTYQETDNILKVELPISLLNSLIDNSIPNLTNKILESNICGCPNEYFLDDAISTITKTSCVIIKKNEPQDVQDSATIEPSNELPIVPPAQDFKDNNDKPKVSNIFKPLRVEFGEVPTSKEKVYWEPTNTERILNTNTGIIGTMGTGKTQFTKSLVAQLIKNQTDNVDSKPIGFLIFDYKADYVKKDFVEATGAQVFDLYRLPFNPFSLVGDKQMLPVHTANLFRTTLSTAFGLGNKQQNKIRSLVIDAYEQQGIYPNDQATWKNLAPTLRSIWDLFQEQEKVEQDSLYAALDDLMSFEIFEPDPKNTRSLYDLIDGVTVINLSGYDSQIQNLVVAIILDIFYTQMHHHGSSKIQDKYRQITKMILVDEADNFMSQDFESLRKILKEGREFGVGTILSTQELTHFHTSDNNYANYILTWIVHRVSNIKNIDIKSIFNTSSKQDEQHLMSQIRELDKHYSLYVDGEKKITKIKDLAFWQLLNQ